MTPGCAQKPDRIVSPAIDLAPFRCPPARPADRKLFAAGPARPPQGALTTDGLKSWVDRLEVQIAARNAAGARVIGDYERCRGDAAPSQ
jgi:hypothetical protein